MSDQMKMKNGNSGGSVECLGMTFPSEDARRDHFLNLLAEKLKNPAFRAQEGFPKGTDEAILAMSDPPYYTACPNPWLTEFIQFHSEKQRPSYFLTREPFATDVSEGKSDAIYGAHAYHTKVPPKAISKYILHYTNPGDVIFDGFSGTGMTGVAAQLCGDIRTIYELGYRVSRDGTISQREMDGNSEKWVEFSKIGPRIPILNDLSPLASFVSSTYGQIFKLGDFCIEAQEAIEKLEKEISWIYTRGDGRVQAGIWSDVFYCPICSSELIYWEGAVENDTISKTFSCTSCGGIVGKAASKDDGAVKLERAFESVFDPYLGKVSQLPKLVLVEESVKFSDGTRRMGIDPIALQRMVHEIDQLSPLSSVPVFKFEEGRQTNKLINGSRIEYAHWMYTPRALFVYGKLWQVELSSKNFTSIFRFCLTAINNYISRKQGYFGGGGGVSGTLFTPSIHLERNIFDALRRKINGLRKIDRATAPRGCVTTQSSSLLLSIPNESVDYIFVDPPFGENFQYAELNSFTEAWLRVKTDTKMDSVMNYVHKKDLSFYLHAMRGAFSEFYRILKPGKWMTVEFSNTQASVWNAIQSGLQEAGFVVANVSALDKKQGSFNAVTNTTSVKQDLVISAYKPDSELENRFKAESTGVNSVWDFIEQHLQYLPVAKRRGAKLEFVVERDPRILFDRMVAWFIRHDVPVPISSQEFQANLLSRFFERDGMIFLSSQVVEYERKRSQVDQPPQMELFVADERSAIDWLTDALKKRPSTYQEIHPEFMTQLGAGWKKHETRPELSALLEDNFLQYDGSTDVPSQIHNYLSTNYHDLRNLEKSDPRLKAKAKDRWFVPDPNKAQDLEKKREKALLKEFEEYRNTPGRKLKEFRLEVLRAGFKAAWASKDYQTIVSIANKVPEDALQEDEKLLFWYDSALTRTGG